MLREAMVRTQNLLEEAQAEMAQLEHEAINASMDLEVTSSNVYLMGPAARIHHSYTRPYQLMEYKKTEWSNRSGTLLRVKRMPRR